MWDPLIELNRDPDARPDEEDVAGWARFFAGRFYDGDEAWDRARWGNGEWRYDKDTRGMMLEACAMAIEILLAKRA